MRAVKIKDNGEEVPEKIEINKLLQKCQEEAVDMKILIGAEGKFSCRLVGSKLNGETLRRRLEKIERDKKKSGEKRERANDNLDFWSLYITNTDS